MNDVFRSLYCGKRVLVTGHTGFKGSWLVSWLLELGAEVYGIALAPDQTPALFDQLGLATRMQGHHLIDIRDRQAFVSQVKEIQPDYVFHLAAQPLVRLSYREPVETFHTNVMGTVHLMDALRELSAKGHPCIAVLATTDKSYENREWLYGYREVDAMGGHDPYSASKGACEIAIASYRQSFFGNDSSVAIASARAGNVIGAGDWAEDRIVPDAVRAWQRGESVQLRSPNATRPWQHVLEPLSGYLTLGAHLQMAKQAKDGKRCELLGSGMNFGPQLQSNRSVGDLVSGLAAHWPVEARWQDLSSSDDLHEAGLLNLAIDKAWHTLQWSPIWDYAHTLQHVSRGYAQLTAHPENAPILIRETINQYTQDACASQISWAQTS